LNEDELTDQWFESFFPATIGMATLGASITFSTIVSKLEDPAHLNPEDPTEHTYSVYSRETVRTFLGISFLLFVITLGVASFAVLLLNFHRRQVKEGVKVEEQRGIYRIGGLLVRRIWGEKHCLLQTDEWITLTIEASRC
jgi:hypothetical protein